MIIVRIFIWEIWWGFSEISSQLRAQILSKRSHIEGLWSILHVATILRCTVHPGEGGGVRFPHIILEIWMTNQVLTLILPRMGCTIVSSAWKLFSKATPMKLPTPLCHTFVQCVKRVRGKQPLSLKITVELYQIGFGDVSQCQTSSNQINQWYH